LAAWALKRATQLSHRQVGELMGMSVHQVGNVLTEIRRGTKSKQIRKWMEWWLIQEEAWHKSA
jgi:hypothetical protein